MSKHSKTRQQRLGDDIAFGVQQSVACLATDWLEAPIGNWVQKKFATSQNQGTLAHNYIGEVTGNLGSLITFLGLRQFFPQSIEWIKKGAASVFGGFYEKAGHKSIKQWAASHHVGEGSAKYQEKLAEWKDFQADNFAKTAVIQTTNLVFNIAGQKAFGSSHKKRIILLGKLIGGVVTAAVVLGFRLIAPKTAKQLDDELSDRYFTPLVYKTQKLFGAETKDKEEFSAAMHPPGPMRDILEKQLSVEKKGKKHKRKHKHAERIQEEEEEPALKLR